MAKEKQGAPSGPNPVDDSLEYSETLQSLRHYSALRFAMLTVFSGASAGLVVISFGSSALTEPAPEWRLVFRVLGLATVCISFWLEIILNGYMEVFGRKAGSLHPKGHWAMRDRERRFGDKNRSAPPTPIILLHAVIAAFWLVAIAASVRTLPGAL